MTPRTTEVSRIRRHSRQETIKCLNSLSVPKFYTDSKDCVDNNIFNEEHFRKNVVARRAISIKLVRYPIQSINGVMEMERSQGQEVRLRFVLICPRM